MPAAFFALSIVVLFLPAPDTARSECLVGPQGTLSVGLVLGPIESEVHPGFDEAVALQSTRPGVTGGTAVPALPGSPRFTVRTGPDSLALDRVPRGRPNLSYVVFRFRLSGPAEARLTAGIPGDAALFLDGRRVRLRGGGPARDDAWEDVTLGAGRHAIAVRSFRRGGDPGDRVIVRLLGRDNRPLAGAVLSWPGGLPAEGCLSGISLEPALVATPDGASGSLSLVLPDRRPVREGLLTAVTETPPQSTASPLRVQVPVPDGDVASIPFSIRLSPGRSKVRVRVLGPDGHADALARDLDLVHRPETVGTLVAARARFAPPGRFETDSLDARMAGLARLLATQDPDDAWVDSVRADLAVCLERVSRGEPAYRGRAGVLDRAYRSPIDGSLRPVTLKVPAVHATDPGARLSLVLMLHGTGFGPRLTLRQVLGLDRDRKRETAEEAERHLPPLPEVPFLIACPWGFGNVGARYLGEEDVSHAIEAIASEYPVDPDRVYLAGLSLGGLGTFHAGLRHPDRFAGLATAAGFASVAQYTDVRGRPRTPWEDFLVRRADDVLFAANGLHLPLWAAHGRRDRPERTLVLVDRYKALGYEVAYREFPTGHEVWRDAFRDRTMFDWLASHRRPDRPAGIRLATGSGRSREAYWLRIDAFERSDALSGFAGEVGPGAGTGCDLRIDTDNVRGLTVETDRLPASCQPPYRLRVDGQPIDADGPPVSVERDGGTWRLADVSTPPGPRKRPGLSGPIDDAYHGPMVFVYGTADPVQTPVNRARAEEDSTLPFLRADARFPVRADAELTAGEARDATLVLYGNPKSNTVLARIADRLPIRFEPGAIVAGSRRHAGEDIGAVFIAPDPDRPGRYVLVKAGTTWQGTLLSRHLPLFLPDYVVFDERVARQTGGRLMDRRPALDGGFFDEEWRVRR